MENNLNSPVKYASFGRSGHVGSPRSNQSDTIVDASDRISNNDDVVDPVEDGTLSDGHDLDRVSRDIDRFTNVLSAMDDKSNAPEVPDDVEKFAKIIESMIAKYNSGEGGCKFGKFPEEDESFLEAVRRMSKLTNAFSDFPSNSSISPSLNRTGLILERAMTFLEEEFRTLLEDFNANYSSNTPKVSKNGSNSSRNDETGIEITLENDFPGYSPEIVAKMNRIANTMVSAGYETECCQAYSIVRRNAFSEQMKKLEFEKINMDDAHKMTWQSLEGEISRWIKVVKACSTILFPGEMKLSKEVFSEHPLTSRSLFSNLARAVVIQLLDFAQAISMTKRSAEKLFKFLDIYETLRELISAVSESCSNDCEHELKSEVLVVERRIGEAAVNIFIDLETSIKTDASKAPVPGGAVHPLTRYVMNYLKYACEYTQTLEQIFQEHEKLDNLDKESSSSNVVKDSDQSPSYHETVASTTPFSVQLGSVMDLLDANLETKSTLYKDPSLRYIFLMNNGRYILQKVKGSSDIHKALGDNWCRKKSTVVRQYHKNYQRETWHKLLQLLSHEGLLVNGKASKQMLKDRFKAFNMMFDEICKVQSTWVVSDEQLQSEIRVSISALVIPAYRAFVGRFRQNLDNSKHVEKYIKYQPDDIETLIDGLFDGNPMSMSKKKP